MSLILYDKDKLLEPFGLINTGVICYMNSLLQALLSCTAFNRIVLENEEYMHKTKIGTVLFEFIICATENPKDTGIFSQKIVSTLVDELKVRHPNIIYGRGQECASEGLSLLLELLNGPEIQLTDDTMFNPISKLFYAKYKKIVSCEKCNHKIESMEYRNQHIIHKYDNLAKDIIMSITMLSGYKCDKCSESECCKEIVSITRIPEILVITDAVILACRLFHQPTIINPTPPGFVFNGIDGPIKYYKIAQVEQSGSLNSGHYISKGIRKGLKPYLFNDQSVGEIDRLSPTPNTFLTFYHVV
jgi:ubiquitin C-terminal hydrolase